MQQHLATSSSASSMASSWDAMDDCLHSWLSGMGAAHDASPTPAKPLVCGTDLVAEYNGVGCEWDTVWECNAMALDDAVATVPSVAMLEVDNNGTPGRIESPLLNPRPWNKDNAVVWTGSAAMFRDARSALDDSALCVVPVDDAAMLLTAYCDHDAERSSDTSRTPADDDFSQQDEEEEVVLERIVKRRTTTMGGDRVMRTYDDDGCLTIRPAFEYLCQWKFCSDPTWEARWTLEEMGYVTQVDAFDYARHHPTRAATAQKL